MDGIPQNGLYSVIFKRVTVVREKKSEKRKRGGGGDESRTDNDVDDGDDLGG